MIMQTGGDVMVDAALAGVETEKKLFSVEHPQFYRTAYNLAVGGQKVTNLGKKR